MEEIIQWFDAEVELPVKDGELVLVRYQSGEMSTWIGSYDTGDGEWTDCDGFGLVGVTHWAEMPKGPEASS